MKAGANWIPWARIAAALAALVIIACGAGIAACAFYGLSR